MYFLTHCSACTQSVISIPSVLSSGILLAHFTLVKQAHIEVASFFDFRACEEPKGSDSVADLYNHHAPSGCVDEIVEVEVRRRQAPVSSASDIEQYWKFGADSVSVVLAQSIGTPLRV